MKAELRLADHTGVPGAKVIEIWYGDEFVGQVVGADGPGVRVISKHTLAIASLQGSMLNVVDVQVKR